VIEVSRAGVDQTPHRPQLRQEGEGRVHPPAAEERVVRVRSEGETEKILIRTSLAPREVPLGEGIIGQLQPRDARAQSSKDARRTAQPLPFRGATPPPRGSDEIQINIGRIEVTAMPPAARPAPPKSKSLNLEEYLRRRNGRNG